jgi:hypothetical protein
VESLSEPFYVRMLLRMEFAMRAKAESVAIFNKTVLIYLLVSKGYGLMAYAIAQLVYSIVLLIIYSYLFSDLKEPSFSL